MCDRENVCVRERPGWSKRPGGHSLYLSFSFLLFFSLVCVCVCVRVCVRKSVCERERETECVCVSECVYEIQRERVCERKTSPVEKAWRAALSASSLKQRHAKTGGRGETAAALMSSLAHWSIEVAVVTCMDVLSARYKFDNLGAATSRSSPNWRNHTDCFTERESLLGL